jgi:glycosyltransferase involved in cell wall biosynthesis
MKLLSAIIPVAPNFEDYESMKVWIQNCTPEHIQIVIVRDSFSETSRMNFDSVLALEIKSHSILVLDGEFHSPGMARNYGFEFSTGDWITFWDCDDIPAPRDVLLELQKVETGTDVIIGQYTINDSSKISVNLFDFAFNPGNWRVLYRRNLISDIKFRNYLWGEDQLFILESGMLSSKIVFSEMCFYNYKIGFNSQLTATRANATSLRNVLDHTFSDFPLMGLSNEIQISSLIMLIKMSMTFVQRALHNEKSSALMFAIKFNLRLFLMCKLNWTRALYEIFKRKALKK